MMHLITWRDTQLVHGIEFSLLLLLVDNYRHRPFFFSHLMAYYKHKAVNNRGFSKRLCQRFGKILPIMLCDGIKNKDINKEYNKCTSGNFGKPYSY